MSNAQPYFKLPYYTIYYCVNQRHLCLVVFFFRIKAHLNKNAFLPFFSRRLRLLKQLLPIPPTKRRPARHWTRRRWQRRKVPRAPTVWRRRTTLVLLVHHHHGLAAIRHLVVVVVVQMRPGRRWGWVRVASVIQTAPVMVVVVVVHQVMLLWVHLILATATRRIAPTPVHHAAIHTPAARLARVIRVALIRHVRRTGRGRRSLINRLVVPVRPITIASCGRGRGRWTGRRIQRIPHRTRPLGRAAGRRPRYVIPVIAIRTAHPTAYCIPTRIIVISTAYSSSPRIQR